MSWGNNNGGGRGPWGEDPGNGPSGKGPGGPRRPDNQELDEILRKSQEKLSRFFSEGFKGKGGQGNGIPPVNGTSAIIGVIAIVLLGLWLSTGIYTVNTKEKAAILRFGKYVRTEDPGLKFRLPTPIERAVKVKVTDRYRTEIGSDSSRSHFRHGEPVEQSEGNAILMLTGDKNMVAVNLEVQWQIDNAEEFLFNVENQEETVRNAAESAMREIIGTTPLNDILSEKRSYVQQQTKDVLQQTLDSYKIGIRIEEVNMRGVPPKDSIRIDNLTSNEDGQLTTEAITTTVDEAFKDVQAALINKEETINSAIARSNELIPQARGFAQKTLQEAEGYKEQAIAKAEGEAKRFLAVYEEYKKAKDVTKQRLYLETMEKILEGMDMIVLDAKGSNGVVPYLPLNELKQR